uniref:Odorant receptor n=1 Tax=Anopheles culicifacies TaxID=139723 RepID=A0A182MAX2_9DIPT
MDPELDQIFSFLRRPLRLLGLDVLDKNWKVTPLTMFIMSMFVVQHYGSFLFLKTHLDAFVVFTECFSTSGVALEIVIRMGLLIYHREMLHEALEAIGNQKHSESFKKLATEFYKVVLGSLRMIAAMYLSTMMFELIPIVYPDPNKSNLPLAIYIPHMPHDVAPYWHLNYAYDTFMNLICVMFLFAVDGILVLSILAAVYQIKGLKLCFQKLDTAAEQSELHRELVRICKTHQSIKNFIRLLERTYYLDLLVDFGLVCLILGMGLNVIAIDITQPIGFYLISVAFQLFLLCSCGNLLLIESDSLSNCVYSIDWYLMPVAEQKMLKFIIANAQPPQMLHGIFMPLIMSSFLSSIPLYPVNASRKPIVGDQQYVTEQTYHQQLTDGCHHQRIDRVFRLTGDHIQAHADDQTDHGEYREEMHLERTVNEASKPLHVTVQLNYTVQVRFEMVRLLPFRHRDLLVEFLQHLLKCTDSRASAYQCQYDNTIHRCEMMNTNHIEHDVMHVVKTPVQHIFIRRQKRYTKCQWETTLARIGHN